MVDKTKLMLNSTQVEDGVDVGVGVELGKISYFNIDNVKNVISCRPTVPPKKAPLSHRHVRNRRI